MKRHFTKLGLTLILLQVLMGTQYAESHVIEQPQPSIEEIIRGFNEEELIIFNEEMGVDPRQLFNAIQENPQEQPIFNQPNRYDALILFILATVALFIISRYGSTILEYLFDIARDMPGAVHRSITGVIRIAVETGRIDAIYNFTTRQAHHFLNDPDTANRVVRGLQRVQQLRNN